MAAIGTRAFKGEIPRYEPHLIGNDNAQRAVDCDFANGSVKPLQGGFLLRNMVNNPVRGIYTEDGINFFTWRQETSAFQSPVIDDTNGRVYYLTPSEGVFSVTTKSGMAFNGPSPTSGNKWKAGVPRCTVAPTLTAIDRTTIPGYENKTLFTVVEAWWEDNAGREYSRAAVAATLIQPLRKFSFEKPAQPAQVPDAPVTYKLCARVVVTDNSTGNEVFSGTMRGTSVGRSTALPGGIEFLLEHAESSSTATVTQRWGVVETRAYVYTVVNTWGEEGAPSPPSTISVSYVQDVQIEVTSVDFTGYRQNQGVYVYRTFGASAAYIQIDYDYPGGGLVGYDRSWKPKPGGHALESSSWTPPPDGLQGVELMPNGWFAAFKGNVLYMSEPYRPHAWPYNMTFAKSIRGIRASQQALVVTTADGVYVVAGAFPAAAQQVKLSAPQPGIAQRSMANVDGAVAYASNDGFITVDGSSASAELGQKLFDRSTWRARYGNQLSDASMRFAFHDGALVSVSANETNGFLLRLDESVGSFTRLTARYDAMFLLPVNDSLYYSSGAGVYQFRGGSLGTMEWHSKDYIFPSQQTFGAGFIRCDEPTTLTIYADGEQVVQRTVSTGYFRLPADMPKRLRWSFKISSSAAVHEIFLARSMMELQNV